MSTTADKLNAVMDQFYGGSDGRTRHPFNRKFIYTDGVKAVADEAGAYWLLDIVATEVAQICMREWDQRENSMTFLRVLVTKGSTAKIWLERDTDDEVFWTRDLEFTDFPEGDWMFYMGIDGLVDQPNEVVVMFLQQEN